MTFTFKVKFNLKVKIYPISSYSGVRDIDVQFVHKFKYQDHLWLTPILSQPPPPVGAGTSVLGWGVE